LGCPANLTAPQYFSFPMERGDGLVWLGETVHLAHGGDRRVLSMTLVDGERTRYDASRKPNLSWDWYEHGVSDGDLIQGPYFPQLYPELLTSETEAREQRQIGYFSAGWTSTLPYIRNMFRGLGSQQPACSFTVDPTV